MVVRPQSFELDAAIVMPTKSISLETGKYTDKHNHSMSRKYVSVSPARGNVLRSKSMNGLSRLNANKINEKGRTSNHSTSRSVRQREINSSEIGSPNIDTEYNGYVRFHYFMRQHTQLICVCCLETHIRCTQNWPKHCLFNLSTKSIY